MATTRLWAVNDNLNRVLEYASNEEKTESKDDLRKVLEYASNNIKTNQLVTGINCSPQNVYKQMKETKLLYGKEDGVQAFHGYQSFAAETVDEATCHKIGIETARRMWGKDYEVLVCTHTNTAHLHNHFVINSVSFRNGKKFDNSHADLNRLMSISDSICKEYNLDIIENPNGKRINLVDYKAEIEGKPYVRGMVRQDVEYAINGSRTMTQFYTKMKKMGYTFKGPDTRVHLTVIAPDGKTKVRLDNINPKGKYTRENIKQMILDNEIIKWELTTDHKSTVKFKSNCKVKNQRKITGIKALYCHYLYLLGILPKKSHRRISFLLSEDIKKIDKYNEEVKFIVKKNINTIDDLNNVKKETEQLIKDKVKERKCCYSKKNRATDMSEKDILEKDIRNFTNEISILRKEVRLCERIEKRSIYITDKIHEINEQREVKENERRSRQR